MLSNSQVLCSSRETIALYLRITQKEVTFLKGNTLSIERSQNSKTQFTHDIIWMQHDILNTQQSFNMFLTCLLQLLRVMSVFVVVENDMTLSNFSMAFPWDYFLFQKGKGTDPLEKLLRIIAYHKLIDCWVLRTSFCIHVENVLTLRFFLPFVYCDCSTRETFEL